MLQIKAFLKTAEGIITAIIVVALVGFVCWKCHQVTKLKAEVVDLQGQLQQAQANEKVLKAGIDQQNAAIETWKRQAADAAGREQDAQVQAQKIHARYQGILARITVTDPPKDASDALVWATDEAARIQQVKP